MEQTGRIRLFRSPDAAIDAESLCIAMLDGWTHAQLSQGFQQRTAARRQRTVRRFMDWSGKYPWQWTQLEAHDFFAELRGIQHLSPSTIRAIQNDLALFLAYIADPAYPWAQRCSELLGEPFVPIAPRRMVHRQEGPESPEKRPFTTRELQSFFDFADDEVERILRSGARGGLAAYRDAVAFKVMYAWGLRRRELCHLKVVDFGRNVRAPRFGAWGILRVRHGKAMRGSPAKQRTVLTVFDWSAHVVADWVDRGLPRFHDANGWLFPTERGSVLDGRSLLRRMRQYTDALGFPSGLDLHSFRRSYATHLQLEWGFDTHFTKDQLGHEHASTTATYTIATPDYRARELDRVLGATLDRAAALPRPNRGEAQS